MCIRDSAYLALGFGGKLRKQIDDLSYCFYLAFVVRLPAGADFILFRYRIELEFKPAAAAFEQSADCLLYTSKSFT